MPTVRTSHRLASLLSLLSLVTLASSAQAAPPSGQQGTPVGGATAGGATTGYGGFSAPPDARYDPSTTSDPGLLDRPRTQAADQTYGATGTGDQLTGYDIVDISVYGDNDWGDSIPDYHVVQEGDSLSAICAYYYGDMYLWPKIWSYNPHITNAHWIFPGDRIRLTDPYEDSSQAGGPDGDGLSYAKTYDPRTNSNQTYLLERYAFIDEEEMDKSMEIVGGADAQVMMATLDVAYIGYDDANPPIAGERLSVYRKRKPVYDIEVKGKKGKQKQGERIGWLVEVVGEIYVDSVAEKSAAATIVDSVRPVERGQRVGELKTRFVRVQPSTNEVTTNGLVVETIREQSINGETMFVIVNLGASDGIRRGNTLEVVQKGDAYTPAHRLHQPYDKGHPRRIIASLLVLQIEGESALTVVTDSKREVVTGDHVEIIAAGDEPQDFEPYDSSRKKSRSSASGSASAGDGSAEASGELRMGN